MHSGAAEGDWCAPSSLLCTSRNRHSVFALFNRRPLRPTSHPQEVGGRSWAPSLGRSWAALPFIPPTQAWPVHSFLFLDLAKLPPRRIDLNEHLVECWRCCTDWGFTSSSGHCPPPRPAALLYPTSRRLKKLCQPHRGLALSSSPRPRSRGDTRTRSR